MKRFVLLSFILFIVNIALAQFSTMFNDTLRPFGDGAYTFDGICKDDSFYYVLGGVNNYQPKWGLMLLKLDKNGVIINRKKYGDTLIYYASYPYNSIEIMNNNLLFISQMTDSLQVVKGFVIAVDKHTLDTLWTRTYPHPDTSSILSNADKFSDLTAIKSTPDGNFILAGNYMSAGSLRSYLMKIDSLGNVLWTKTYNNYSGFYEIGISSDSSFYLPCTRNNTLKLINVDKSGLYKWEVGFNSNSNPSYPISISVVNNVYIVVSSSYWYDLTNSLRGITISKINIITKSISWEKNYILFNNFTGITLHQAMGVETLSNGSIIVSGTVSKTGADRNGVILKLNSNGDSLWTKTYHYGNPNYDDCQLNDLIVTDDGGFMGVGFLWSQMVGVNDAAWMFKTDANGVVGWESPKAQSRDKHFKLYPNPALDYTTLSYNCKFANMTYSIVDMQGKTLITASLKTIEDLSSNEILIDLSKLSIGSYQILIKTNNTLLWSEKLIITK